LHGGQQPAAGIIRSSPAPETAAEAVSRNAGSAAGLNFELDVSRQVIGDPVRGHGDGSQGLVRVRAESVTASIID
jgi:hypothetical protein